MQAILLSSEEVAKPADRLYESRIRPEVEIEENIGKMVIIDIFLFRFCTCGVSPPGVKTPG